MVSDHNSIKVRASKIKLALFDVDGTLFNAKGLVSEATELAIKRLRARGIITGLATGRPLFLARSLLDKIVDGPAMLCAGATVVSRIKDSQFSANQVEGDGTGCCETYREVYRAVMPDELSILAETLIKAKFSMLFTNNEGSALISDVVDEPVRSLLTYYPKSNRDGCWVDGYATMSIGEALDQVAPLKLDIPFIASERREAFEKIMAEFPQFQTQFASGAAHPGLAFVNVLPAHATRPRALTELLKHLPGDLGEMTAENLFVIGDGESDLGLFDVAGLAVAMGNAPRVVQDRAHFVTRSVEDDGVAAFVNEFFI